MAACCAPCSQRSALGVAPLPEPTQADKINELRAQLNRYTAKGLPSSIRGYWQPFAPEGLLDLPLAIAAMMTVRRRAELAGDEGIVLLRRAVVGQGDPINFVGANIDEVLSTVKYFADVHDLPAAKRRAGKNPWLGPVALLGVAVMLYLVAAKD